MTKLRIYYDKNEVRFLGFNAENEEFSFDIIEFCKSLNINLKVFVKEFNKVSTEIRSSLNDDILVGSVSEGNIDFYEKYRIDINNRF
ncbi:hypothetical protein [Poseidonibacter ostreae]|uniref:Uncharacterized protein n=1 Tax=Poseidonibacter ostreae TaxID=2654171 RepID=A0A6L4WN48_9BACT|nr:hypothetical protein [Poseidonibacter ostreae]KAB7881226.1 hypothetical protein GA417_14220 [Poseidonibacter ostreae]KAB7884232.1 hypothetical protein GBG19_16055 [Poseidonibacter ostreae]KAB7886343.1 hypothetical protein GBG18_14690 [Poseidonibacter ostreae]